MFEVKEQHLPTHWQTTVLLLLMLHRNDHDRLHQCLWSQRKASFSAECTVVSRKMFSSLQLSICSWDHRGAVWTVQMMPKRSKNSKKMDWQERKICRKSEHHYVFSLLLCKKKKKKICMRVLNWPILGDLDPASRGSSFCTDQLHCHVQPFCLDFCLTSLTALNQMKSLREEHLHSTKVLPPCSCRAEGLMARMRTKKPFYETDALFGYFFYIICSWIKFQKCRVGIKQLKCVSLEIFMHHMPLRK